MTLAKFPKIPFACAVLLASALASRALAQGPLPDAPAPAHADVLVEPMVVKPPVVETRHRFWDKENSILFAATAALSGADFAVTRANLENGGRELNPVVRWFGTSTPALAANFAGETVGVVTISYLFHKTGHHRLERAVSIVDIGGSSGAVAYGLAHR